MKDGQKALLDRRDKIEAVPIEKEEDWVHAFRQVAACLEKRRRGAPAPPAAVAADAFAYARAQYLAGLEAHYGVANLQGLYQWGAGYARDDVLLDEVFVEPDLERAERGARAGEGAVAETEALERAGLSFAMRARRRGEQAPTASRTPAFQVLAQEQRVLIVGAPGQGKSTLLGAWLLSVAARWREQPALHPLPVLVRLAEWESDPQRGEGWLREHVSSKLPRLAEVGSAAVEAWLRGPVLWLLDGIDEVRDPHERGRLLAEVRATAAMRPQDRWAVTTRPAGEPAGGIGSGWLRCELPSLSDPQVEQVLAKWAGVLQRKEQLVLDHRQMASALKADPGLRLMRGNGLLLTMAVLFYKSRKRLPHHRWEFYDGSEQALRDGWVRHRLQQAQRYLPGDYLPELLEVLALDGMVEGSVLFAEEDVKQEADSLLRARGYSGGERDQEVARLLEAARDLIGVLVEQGPSRFGFLHVTFQEFYAARALVHRSQNAAGYIKGYWDHPDWREVWPLYRLGVQADPARTAELFQTILADAHPLDEYLFRPQLACLRLLGTGSAPVSPPETGVLDWARSIIERTTRPFQEVCTIVQRWERPLGTELREALLGRLADQDWNVRWAVARALAAAVSEPAVREALLGRLADEDWNVRWAAAQALAAAVSEPAVREALLGRLADQDWNVRGAAAQALGAAVSEPAVREALLGRLADEDWNVRWAAAQALGAAVSEPAVREALLGRLADEDWNVRWAAAQALAAAVSEPAVREALLGRLADEDWIVRWAAAQALGAAVSEPAVREALLGRLADQDWNVRGAAAQALGAAVSEPAVREALLGRLADQDWNVRWAAAQALGAAVSEPAVREALLGRLADQDWNVWRAAAQALGAAVSEPAVREALLGRLADQDWNVRWAVARALAAAVASEKFGIPARDLGDVMPW